MLQLDLLNISNLYSQGYSAPYIAKLYECSNTTIYKFLRSNNISIEQGTRLRQRKYKLDETFFDIINTQEKAYILGFLYADGYNNTNRGAVTLTIQKLDKHILYDMRKFFTEAPITTYTKSGSYKPGSQEVRLRIDSKYISKQLEKLGCTNKKSFTLEFPDLIDSMIPHFIRGYLDGDGCISISKLGVTHVSIISSEKFIINFCNIVNKLIKIIFTKKDCTKCPQVFTADCTSRNDAIKFLDWIYKDSTLRLTRKYNKYLQLKELGEAHYGYGNKGLANTSGDNIQCPRCDSYTVSKRGFEKGKRRYQCNECNRAFVLAYNSLKLFK